jgi:hypothetical protein
VLHRALADAERLRLVMHNVAHLSRPPAVPQVEPATWTADELRSFLEHAGGDRLFIGTYCSPPPGCAVAKCSVCDGETSTSSLDVHR